MIRYRRINENVPPDDIVRFGDIAYAGRLWTILDIRNDIVTLLLSDRLERMDFRPLTEYRDSNLRRYLLNEFLPDLESEGADIIPTRIENYPSKSESLTDKVYLLSAEEADKLPKNIRTIGDSWWLRTITWEEDDPWSDYIHMEPWIINRYGEFDFTPRHIEDALVRPAIRVRIEDLQSPAAY